MRVITILAILVTMAFAGCAMRGTGQNLSCLTVTQHDAEVISNHLTAQIVSQNEYLGC